MSKYARSAITINYNRFMVQLKATNLRTAIFLLSALLSSFTACSKLSLGHHYPVKKVVLTEGDTLSATLETLELPSNAQSEIIEKLTSLFNPKYLRPGDYYEIAVDTPSNPSWKSFSYFPRGQEFYTLTKSASGMIEARKTVRAVKKESRRTRGIIRSSLWEAMTEQRLEPDLIMDFADVFASHIDFLTEPRTGDRFKVIYEETKLENGKTLHRQITAAQYIASGKEFTAILFTNSDGTNGYYAPDGNSMASAFLRAPLQYRRISSYFSMNRYHPIFKIYRPHLGIDYAAPQGTPVSSIGKGTVKFSGWNGGTGNSVHIKHPNGFVSYYGHLSRIAKNINAGARVNRGQLIGYVGMTGIATGPHLDFRIKKDGLLINFLRLKIPPTTKIKDTEKERFSAVKKDALKQLGGLSYQ